jgi:hypothetical protein
MCLYVVLRFQDCQPLILQDPEAGRELRQRALSFSRVQAFFFFSSAIISF